MQMTARERTLAFIVGTIVVAVLSFILVQFFVKNQKALTRQFAEKTQTLAAMKTLIAERDLWQQRESWVQQNQPRLDNANSAGVALVDQIKDIAKERGLTLTEAQIGVADSPGSNRTTALPYEPVSASFNIKAKWEEIVTFLYDVQTPTNFLVFEKATLQVDKQDKTAIGGSFKVAKWYAPNPQ